MKYIFLDIDGVLNPLSTKYQRLMKDIGIDPSKLFLLKRLVDSTGAETVLSSSWRSHRKCREDIGKVFEKFGLTYRNCTPDYQGETTRGEEISAWFSIQDNSEKINYVILDDYPKSQFIGHENHFINVDCKKRLSEENIELAFKMLSINSI
ncbi:MAG: HAD domain-containing protein [Oscillospiraceae bacterium]|nr:HAD domain-containing protein [Oscillospiraceae bacterium]